ncbi:boophilin-G2 [Takifugu rubripes]|uniref:boophilin-G2 n=1 Tax=Takifugu rubripes TaxID=31033 RepID=UPI00114553B1|nr:boophilin-G2-like [Takifugu rubripes]
MIYLLVLGITFVAFCPSQSIPNFCQLPNDEGEGKNYIFSLFYDANLDQCSPFLYKGEGGNDNRFENERDCIRNCSANSEDIYPMDASLACHFKRDSGKCSGQYLRYYYDPIHAKCKKFQWTGCVGNGNRFLNLELCNSTCAGIHDHGEEEEEDEPDTPIAIICGVVLGIIVVALLITVIVLAVQSEKKSSAKKAGGKKREEKAEVPLRDQGIEMS